MQQPPERDPDGQPPAGWDAIVQRAQREAVRDDAGREALRAPGPAPLWRAWWLHGGAGALLMLAVGLVAWQHLRPLPAPSVTDLDQGRRALLSLVSASLADHVRLHGGYPDNLGSALPLDVSVEYRRTPEGYELSVRLSDGQLLLTKAP